MHSFEQKLCLAWKCTESVMNVPERFGRSAAKISLIDACVSSLNKLPLEASCSDQMKKPHVWTVKPEPTYKMKHKVSPHIEDVYNLTSQ